MKVSDEGLAFLAAHEGFVSRGYLDPAGVVTIGYGFTMRSRIFAAWWRARHGQRLAIGDRLSREQANRLLLKLLDEEYAPPVRSFLPGLTQPQFDACVSLVYNLGARALSWRWARALKGGDVAAAASLIKRTGTTAAGRRLNGLIKRRLAEAALLQHGEYGLVQAAAAPEPGSDILSLQRQLKGLGHDPGPLDGVWGSRTRTAVRSFQRANPPLAVDGVPGPATSAALSRAMAARNGTGLVGALSLVAGAGLVSSEVSVLTASAVAGVLGAVSLAGLLIWTHRGGLWQDLCQFFRRS